MSNTQISYGESVLNPTLSASTLHDVFETIKTGTNFRERIEAIQLVEDKDERKILKQNTLPYFNLGTFKENYRNNDNLISTEFMIIDADGLEDIELLQLKLRCIEDPTIYSCFISPSGNGLKIIYRFTEPITENDHYTQNYKYYAEKFEDKYNIETDTTSDSSRACFFSHDPELYLNESADTLDVKEFVKTVKKEKAIKPVVPSTPTTGIDFTTIGNNDEQFIPSAVEYLRTRINGYGDWTRAGMALASLGESGRSYFQELSSNPSYSDSRSDVDSKFSNFLRTSSGKIQIATLFEIAKGYGYNYDKKPEQQTSPVTASPSEFYEELIEQFEFDDNRDPNEPIGYKLKRFNSIEKELDGLQMGYYHLGADSNVGKSAVMHNLALDLIDSNDDLTVLLFSQDDPKINASYRMIALLGDLAIHDSKKGMTAIANDTYRANHLKEARAEYIELLKSERLVMKDASDIYQLDKLEKVVKSYYEKSKRIVVIIDGLYNLEVSSGKEGIRMENIERAQYIKRIVDTYKIPLITTGELRKKTAGDTTKTPTIDDLMESGKFAYNANVVWLLYADSQSEKNATEVKVNLAYAKNKVSGFKGKLELTFVRAEGKMIEGWSAFSVASSEEEEV